MRRNALDSPTALVSLHLVCADYTTETWELRAGDNIIGCFNAPGLGTFDWNNCVGVPAGDKDFHPRLKMPKSCPKLVWLKTALSEVNHK